MNLSSRNLWDLADSYGRNVDDWPKDIVIDKVIEWIELQPRSERWGYWSEALTEADEESMMTIILGCREGKEGQYVAVSTLEKIVNDYFYTHKGEIQRQLDDAIDFHEALYGKGIDPSDAYRAGREHEKTD